MKALYTGGDDRPRCSPGTPRRTTARCWPARSRWCSTPSPSPARPRTRRCRSPTRSGSPRRRKGPVRRMGLEHVMSVYVIWKFAENIDGREEVPGRLHRQLPPGLRGERVLQLPLLPQAGPGPQAALAKDTQGEAGGQVRGARRRARLGDQRRLPRLRQRGDRRGLQHLGAEHDVRPGRHRRDVAPRTRSRRPRTKCKQDLGEVEGAEAASRLRRSSSRADRWPPSRRRRCARSSPATPRWTASISRSTRASSWSSSGRRGAARPRCCG